MSILSDADLTEIAHILILLGVIAAYLKSKQVQNLVEIQKSTIETLQQGFDACKQRLNDIEKMINKDSK